MKIAIRQLIESFKSHSPLLIFSLLYAVLASYVASVSTLNVLSDGFAVFIFLLFGMTIIILSLKAIAVFLHMLFVVRPEKPLKYWFNDIKSFFLNRIKIMYSLPLMMALFIFMNSFTIIKSQIPVVNPFSFDTDLHNLDVLLHFGHMPADLLHSFLSHPIWSTIFEYIYSLWFFIITYAFFLSCFGFQKYELGIRYIIASLLLWSVAGNGMAMLFSSAGPCFYGQIGLSPDPYSGLMATLRNISENYSPVMSLEIQNMLWQGYQTNNSMITGGISAFPSLHVATSVLVAQTAFAQKISIKWILAFFALMILLGSVYLGWHYAIDGYVSIFLGLGAWKLSKPISDWYMKRKAFKVPY